MWRFEVVSSIVFTLLSLAGAYALGWRSSHAEIIDQIEGMSIEKIASIVCESTSSISQISKISTPRQISDFLEGLVAPHPLIKCRNRYGKSLIALAQVLETGNQDICGDAKLAEIERFNRLYVSMVRKHTETRKNTGADAPKLVKIFFMHYARTVSTLCAESAIKVLDSGSISVDKLVQDEQLIESLATNLGFIDLSNGYDSIFPVWSLVDKINNALSHYILPDGPYKLVERDHLGPGIEQVKDACRQHLRPLYVRTLLPAVRLIDMGYYPKTDNLAKTIRWSIMARKIYMSMQTCELVLSIRSFEDRAQPKEQVNLVTKNKAEQLLKKVGEPETDPAKEPEPIYTPVSMESVKVLESAETADAYQTSKLMRSIIKGRAKTCKRLAELYARRIRLNHKFQGQILKLSSEKENAVVEQQMKEVR